LPFFKRQKDAKRAKKRDDAYKLLEEIDRPKVAAPIIIKEVVKEGVEMVNCLYCQSVMPTTSTKCPHCGAPRKK
jgi:rubrerythrin